MITLKSHTFYIRFDVHLDPVAGISAPTVSPADIAKLEKHFMSHRCFLLYPPKMQDPSNISLLQLGSLEWVHVRGGCHQVSDPHSGLHWEGHHCGWSGEEKSRGRRRMLKQKFQVKLARLELLFQTDHWGSVEWAHDIEEFDTTARLAAATLFVQLSSTETKTRNKQPQMWYFLEIFGRSQNTSKVILIWSSEMSKRNSSAVARLKQDYIRLKKDPVLQSTCLVQWAVPHYFRNLQVPYIVAEPLPSNLLEWHYVVRWRVYTSHTAKWNINLPVMKYWRTYFSAIRGPEDSLYKGGIYHGKLVFPSGT